MTKIHLSIDAELPSMNLEHHYKHNNPFKYETEQVHARDGINH